MTSTSRRQVPETVAGFGYQFERALLWLSQCKDLDAVVGVETDDDIAVKDARATNLLEQAKLSYADSGHPFQDRSIGLWKTLDGWLAAARGGSPLQRTGALHLVTNRPVPAGCLARRLANPEKTAEDLAQCIRDLRAIASQPADSINKYTQRLASATDQELEGLIARIRLADAHDRTGNDEIRDEIISELHLPPDVDATVVLQNLYGWLVHTVQELWRRREPGWVSRRSLDRQVHALLDQLKRRRSRERADRFVPVCPTEREKARRQSFVARLVEIDVPDDEIISAIDSYLRHSTEKYRLSQLGEYTQDDWADFYSELEQRWIGIWFRVRRMAQREQLAPEAHGQQVLADTIYNDYCGPLAGEPTVHAYFTSGGYHRLADHDRVWWSPNHTPNASETSNEE